MADGKSFDIDVTRPGIVETFDSIRGEDQVEIKRAVLELNEILASDDLRRSIVGDLESQISQRGDDRGSVLGQFGNKQVCILSGVGEPEQDRPGFPDEQ